MDAVANAGEDRGELLSSIEPLLIPEGSRHRAALNELAFELVRLSSAAASRFGLRPRRGLWRRRLGGGVGRTGLWLRRGGGRSLAGIGRLFGCLAVARRGAVLRRARSAAARDGGRHHDRNSQ